jgi:phosphate transport system substrate-binding protein
MNYRNNFSGKVTRNKRIMTMILMGAIILSFLTPVRVRAQDKLQGNVSISGAWALYPMAVKWAEEFRKIHPLVRIDISAGGAGKGMTDVISGLVDIGMVSREIYPAETKKGALSFAMVRDAVVPVVNASNPVINDILSKGLKKDAAYNIWITGKCISWSQVLATKSKAPVHVYTRSDACGAAETWAKYFGKKQEDLLGSGVYGDPGLALAVKKDLVGIGYNNIGYAYDHTSRKPVSGLRVIPLDLNSSGKIDPDESFYGTLDEIVEAVSQGKYPSPPARDLYFVTKGRPQNKAAAEFIRWALTEGQKYVKEAGYINLSREKISGETGKL